MATKFKLLMLFKVFLTCPQLPFLAFSSPHVYSPAHLEIAFFPLNDPLSIYTLCIHLSSHGSISALLDPILSYTETLLVEDYRELRILWTIICATI